jgi:endonuclease/exonuclease/phosphatase family metal-dependent hydrolase
VAAEKSYTASALAIRIHCLALLTLVCACRSENEPPPAGPDASVFDAGDGFPEARNDFVSAVGTPGNLDIATWNVENFPKNQGTARILADLIRSMDLDLVALQEIQSIAAFDEVVARLPDHDGLLSGHTYGNGTYQKIGFIYRSDLITVDSGALLFQNNGYEFPRPPFQTTITVSGSPGFDFIAATVHLKAGFGAEDIQRREQAIELLEGHMSTTIAGIGGDPEYLLFGDFNETLDAGRSLFAPLLDPAYTVHTDAVDEYSYIPSQALLDHMVSSQALTTAFAGAEAFVARPDLEMEEYLAVVSDHLPVVIALPLPQ